MWAVAVMCLHLKEIRLVCALIAKSISLLHDLNVSLMGEQTLERLSFLLSLPVCGDAVPFIPLSSK